MGIFKSAYYDLVREVVLRVPIKLILGLLVPAIRTLNLVVPS
jgi:hypothetical protein